MLKGSPRHWVGYLTDDDVGGLVLYDHESPDRSADEVYLYHFNSDKMINHFKHSVRKRLRPLHEHEIPQVEKVKEAYLENKLRYFRHLIKHRESGFRHAIPTEFPGLSHTIGGGPWELFNGKLRDDLLNGEIFYTLKEAQILIEQWREDYNNIRPHSSLGYQPPAPHAVLVKHTESVKSNSSPLLIH